MICDWLHSNPLPQKPGEVRHVAKGHALLDLQEEMFFWINHLQLFSIN